jgi:hypothetical protein
MQESLKMTLRGKAYTGIGWGNLREGDHLKDPGVDGRLTLEWIFEKCGMEEGDWTGSIRISIGTAVVNEVMNHRVA